jgi:hypothetical protein
MLADWFYASSKQKTNDQNQSVLRCYMVICR